MGYRNQLAQRPHVSPQAYLMELIGNGRCWHFDAWLYDFGAVAFYFVIETRAGGRDLLERRTYRLAGGTMSYTVDPPPGEPVTLHDRALAPYYAELNEAHWRYIRPMAALRPEGYTSTSMAFHYIRAPSLEPLDADANFFQYGRK